MYVVVLKNTRNDATNNRLHWTTFKDKEHFEDWFELKIQLSFIVVSQDISEKEAITLCNDKEATTLKNNGQRMRRVFFENIAKKPDNFNFLKIVKLEDRPYLN